MREHDNFNFLTYTLFSIFEKGFAASNYHNLIKTVQKYHNLTPHAYDNEVVS